MLFRTLAAVLAAMLVVALPTAAWRPAMAQAQQIAAAELMRATALDVVFTQFAATIAASARSEDISRDEIFLKHWEATAEGRVRCAGDLHRRLRQRARGASSPPKKQAELHVFFRLRVRPAHDQARARGGPAGAPAAQLAAIARGERLLADASVIRTTQIERLMELVAAEISAAMVGQSVRAMLVGLSVSHQQGQIVVPWPEIDAQVTAMMPALATEIGRTQRAMMAYAYRDLTEAELDAYVEFLVTPAAQKFYAVAAYSVGRIVTDGMSEFGTALAHRMRSVSI
jgi:hypothetical protein